MNLGDIIVQEALKYVGEKEKPGNNGFYNQELEQRILLTDWDYGQSWCAALAEAVWVDGYSRFNSGMINTIRSLCTLNAVFTFRQFEKSKFVTNKIPAPGAIVIWMKMRNGEPVYLTDDKMWVAGHAGICIEGYQRYFETVEGNSNAAGGREGIEVAHFKDKRTYDWDCKHGLRPLGFIHPLETLW